MTDAIQVEIIRAIPATIAAASSLVAVALGFHNKGTIQETKAQIQAVKDQTQEIKTNTDGLVSKLITAKDEKSALAVDQAHTEGVAQGVQQEQEKQ